MKQFVIVVIVLLAAAPAAIGQQLKPRLARVGVVQVQGRRPVLEVVANAPLAFNVIPSGKRLDVRIYGVEAGLVPLDQMSAFGRIVLVPEAKRGNLLLRITPQGKQTFDVKAGSRPNVIEITPR